MMVTGIVRRCLVACLLLAVAQAASMREDATPLLKVIGMLEGMVEKGKKFKQEESVNFAKFSQYCETTRKQTQDSIKLGAENIVQTTAAIGKNLADAEELGEDIKDLQADVEKMETELGEARNLRKKEKAHYDATHKDFTESIDAIKRALKAIKAKSKDIPQSLLQLQNSALISIEARSTIQSFMALGESVDSEDNSEDEAPPKPKAYEFQSGGIIAILEKLQRKFEDQKTNLETEEANTQANFKKLEQKLTDSIKNGKGSISDKTTFKSKKLEAAAEGKSDLDVTKKGKAADEKKLDDLNVECDSKSKEYDKNQVTRADELKAMSTAIEVLQSTTGTAKKHKVFLQEAAAAVSLAQLRAGSENKDKRRELVTYLQRRAQKLGSKYLSVAAARALTDPMVKVKKMIKDLIVKLMEEANAEADQKGFCDKELGTNKQTRDSKSADIEELTAEVEKLVSDLANMNDQVKDLGQERSDIAGSQKKATEVRQEEKAVNTETVNEAKEAQVAVERAISVLKTFYAKASESFLQESDGDSDSMAEEMSEASNAPYQGMQAAKGGIIGMLDVILSDFAKLQSTTETAEDDAVTKYEKFMDESTQDSEVKGVELEHLTKKVDSTEETIRDLKKELMATQDELDAALTYYEKLKPDCVDTGVSYQDRVQMRQAEIQSLQDALKTLSVQA